MATTDASGSSLLPVVASGLPEEVEVRLIDPSAASKQDEDKGRGAFSLRCFSAGAAVMKELPFVAVQDVSNRHRAWTCSHCFTFLQSLEAQFNWHRKQTEAILGVDEDDDEVAPLPEGVLLRTDVVECWHACGEMYCSERCRDAAYAEHHEALCVGRVDSELHPLVVFKKHAVEHNELFLLAAHVVVRVFNTIRASETAGGLDLGYAQRFMDSFCHRPWLEVITAARQSRKAAAHDHGDDGDDEDEDDDEFSQEMLQQLLDESYTSLAMALFLPPSPFFTEGQGKGPLAELFTPDFYSHLLGLLEMNQNAIRIVSPLQTYATLLHDHLFPSEAQAQETALGELGNGELPSFTDAHTTQNTWERLNAMSELLTLVEQIQGDDDECDDDDEDEDADGGSGHHHAHDKKAKAKHHEDSEEDEGDRKGKGKSKAERGSDSEAETAEEEDDNKPVELFPPFEGFGLFPIAAMMNHSCEPNTQVKFGRNREAVVVALCDIAEGEELTHSYIENDRPLAERQADLLEYNFVCQCVRCLKETTVA